MAANPADDSTQTTVSGNAGRRRLAAIVAAVALLWLFVLPAIGQNPAMQAAIAEREAQGIDSGAMFYTELELMGDVLARLKQFHREHPDALWVPGRSR